MNISLVIPTIRNLDFLTAWDGKLDNVSIIIVEDQAKKTVEIPKINCKNIHHYSHEDIERDMKENAWIFPCKSAAVRSYGFYLAYKEKADIIISLDDDCYPYEEGFIQKHIDNLSIKIPSHWYPTFWYKPNLFSRGFPYLIRNEQEVALSHGLWMEIPDFDAVTQLSNLHLKISDIPPLITFVPNGYFFPMSSMNIAFRRNITPLMYQILMGTTKDGKPWQYDRFDDIWCGIFAKKILDHLKFGVVNGSPYIRHNRASDPFKNLQKEALGIEMNETLWKIVDDVLLTCLSPISCYKELNSKIKYPPGEYFRHLKKAIDIWLNLFSE